MRPRGDGIGNGPYNAGILGGIHPAQSQRIRQPAQHLAKLLLTVFRSDFLRIASVCCVCARVCVCECMCRFSSPGVRARNFLKASWKAFRSAVR